MLRSGLVSNAGIGRSLARTRSRSVWWVLMGLPCTSSMTMT